MAALEGKMALVTGSSRGYGRAIAERLARDGALVAVHYAVNEQAAEGGRRLDRGERRKVLRASLRRSTDRPRASTCSLGGWTTGSPG